MKRAKIDNSSHFAKHRFITKTFCCNPPLDLKCVFLTCLFWNSKHVEQETQLKIRKSKDKKKEFQRENKTGNQKKRKDWRENTLYYNTVMLFFSIKQKQRRKKKEKETKARNQKKTKKKTRRKEEQKTRERQRKRKWKRGGRKRLRRNKGRHSKINKKALLGGKTGFSY